jgi:hypothetical protein
MPTRPASTSTSFTLTVPRVLAGVGVFAFGMGVGRWLANRPALPASGFRVLPSASVKRPWPVPVGTPVVGPPAAQALSHRDQAVRNAAAFYERVRAALVALGVAGPRAVYQAHALGFNANYTQGYSEATVDQPGNAYPPAWETRGAAGAGVGYLAGALPEVLGALDAYLGRPARPGRWTGVSWGDPMASGLS